MWGLAWWACSMQGVDTRCSLTSTETGRSTGSCRSRLDLCPGQANNFSSLLIFFLALSSTCYILIFLKKVYYCCLMIGVCLCVCVCVSASLGKHKKMRTSFLGALLCLGTWISVEQKSPVQLPVCPEPLDRGMDRRGHPPDCNRCQHLPLFSGQ